MSRLGRLFFRRSKPLSPSEREALAAFAQMSLNDVRRRAREFEAAEAEYGAWLEARALPPKGAKLASVPESERARPSARWRQLERQLRARGAWQVHELGERETSTWATRLSALSDTFDRPGRPAVGPAEPAPRVRPALASALAMRVAVVDIGTNSTRLLIADVAGGELAELDRRSVVTRLGEGVDASGELGAAPQQRVFDVLEQYTEAIEAAGCEARTAVMTSAVRDASNGAAFAAAVRDRYGLEGRTLTGDEEARYTFAGATAARPGAEGVLVIDIGGGSTELVVGARGHVDFHVSTQAGVVRHSERHLASDPPAPDQLAALRRDARAILEAGAPAEIRGRVTEAIAVAGTATSCASIDLALDPYDPARTEGHVLTTETLDALLALLAGQPLEQRRQVTGLHPDRAPTIVAGVAILLEVLDAFGLERATVSDRDILWGVALDVCSIAGS